VIFINLGSVWLRARTTGRMLPFYLASVGVVVLIASKFVHGFERAALLGVVLTLAGSLFSSLSSTRRHKTIDQVSVASN
jgi:drug/metabolite transporter (DMT)-like permease